MTTVEDRKHAELEVPAPVQTANLPVVDEAHASPEVAQLYARFREMFGRPQVPWILQCFATHPPLLEHMMGLAHSMLFTEGALGRMQKEMISTAVSSRNRCAYCTDSHAFALRMNGGSAELLDAAIACDHNSQALNPAQSALIRFAQKITDDSASINPADIEMLRAAGWNDLQIAEAIHVAALFACFNRVVNGFGLPSQNLLSNNHSKLSGMEERGNQ
jgi:uncharacterized peroxidase-related enzyme